jgi:hypothetical protein
MENEILCSRHTWLWRVGRGKVDALLDGLFDLSTAISVAWASYELALGGRLSTVRLLNVKRGAGIAKEVCTRARPNVRKVVDDKKCMVQRWFNIMIAIFG